MVGASAQVLPRAAPLVHPPRLTLVLLVAALVAGALAQVVVGEDREAPVLMLGASALARGRAATLVHPLRLDTMAESLVHVLVGEDREALDALMAAASAQARAWAAPLVHPLRLVLVLLVALTTSPTRTACLKKVEAHASTLRCWLFWLSRTAACLVATLPSPAQHRFARRPRRVPASDELPFAQRVAHFVSDDKVSKHRRRRQQELPMRWRQVLRSCQCQNQLMGCPPQKTQTSTDLLPQPRQPRCPSASPRGPSRCPQLH